jgi:thioredoxin-related protein
LLPLVLILSGCGKGSDSTDSTASQSQPAPPTTSKPGWITSYDQGQQEAQVSHKLMLLDFTGSDWCGWCKLLDKEVFSQPQFKEYASKNLVLVEVDFPRRKRLADDLRTQNVQLMNRYQIQGFPTIVLINGNGEKVGELGYIEGGPAAFIAELERFRKG